MQQGYNILSDYELRSLRNHGIINENEIALKAGDLFVAENIATKERRVIPNAKEILTESKRILKG